MIHCSFCGKSQEYVNLIITGTGANICDECVELCNEIVTEELRSNEDDQNPTSPSPESP